MYIYCHISLISSLECEMFLARVVEKIKTHILCWKTFSPENRAFYEIMWENMVEPDKLRMT